MIFGGVLDVTYGKYIVLHVICKCPNKDFIVDVLWLYAIMLHARLLEIWPPTWDVSFVGILLLLFILEMIIFNRSAWIG